MKALIERASLATLTGILTHYLAFYLLGSPLWTNTIAEWIMARTPSHYALWLLANLGPWAKPFAMTGGLAGLGFAVFIAALARPRRLMPVAAAAAALAFAWWFEYRSFTGQLSFWLPATLALVMRIRPASTGRRRALAAIAGTFAVAAESYLRDRAASRRATVPRALAQINPPPDTFAPGLVRPPVTPADTFFAMSKNTVDPSLDTRDWQLRITLDGRPLRTLTCAGLLEMPPVSEYVTLRCVSNTLQSDLMATALWTGVRLNRLIDAQSLPKGILEIAVIGADGHGDSFHPDYLFSDAVMLAYGMNGQTLNRAHGFPLRLIAPRYYGFKNVKWIAEIALRRAPYTGTWPKMGYTKEPIVHTASHVDRIVRAGNGQLRVGGVSFAGDRGIAAVRVRADRGDWAAATLEPPLARFTWTRWHATLTASGAAKQVEAQALDGAGRWQESVEGPLFPDGVKGPTIRRLS